MELLIESFISTIQTTTNLTPIQSQEGIKNGYCSSIQTDHHLFYFCCNEEFLRILSNAMLFEDNPTKEVLNDLCKELANLVIGQAKVLCARNEVYFQIKTPHFLGETDIPSDSLLEGFHFHVENGKCSIYKETL